MRTADINEHPRRYWYWPGKKHLRDRDVESTLPITSSDLELAIPPSTFKNLIFRVDNVDILSEFSNQ